MQNKIKYISAGISIIAFLGAVWSSVQHYHEDRVKKELMNILYFNAICDKFVAEVFKNHKLEQPDDNITYCYGNVTQMMKFMEE